nr:MAG TPA: hypothetical protein [Caudoviricetes sp.]
MRWYKVKLVTLQMMFSNDTANIVIDDNSSPYIAAMPGAANSCLNLIATSVRHVSMSYQLEQDGTKTGIQRYDFNELASDFYSFDDSEIYFEDEYGNYGKASNYNIENKSILLIDGSVKGKWTVHYNAYPDEITEKTKDDYELPLCEEVAVLLPFYMASLLYMDDDITASTMYWNRFVILLEEAKETAKKLKRTGYDEFINTKGWY